MISREPPMLEIDLITFIQLVETLSFTKTAAKQNSTQATVSRRIKELETRLNLSLVKRSTRSINITDTGQRLYQSLKKQQHELDSLVNSLHTQSVTSEGTIKVALPVAVGDKLISPYLGDFLKQNPGINLQIFYQNNPINLVNDQFDLAIVANLPKQQTTLIKLLYKLKTQLYCTPSYIEKNGQPQSLAELKDHLVCGWINNDLSIPKNLYITDTRTGKIICSSNNSRILLNGILHATQIASNDTVIVGTSDCLLKEELKSGAMVKILPDYIFGEVPYYLTRLSNNKNPLTDKFIYFIEDCFAKCH